MILVTFFLILLLTHSSLALGPSPTHAISLLNELNVLPVICLSTDFKNKNLKKDMDHSLEGNSSEALNFEMIPKAFAFLDWLASDNNSSFPLFRSIAFPKLPTYLSMIAFPFLKNHHHASEITENLKVCFKLRNKEIEFLSSLCYVLPIVLDSLSAQGVKLASHFPNHSRVQLGLLVRLIGKRPINEHYSTIILLCLIYELLQEVKHLKFKVLDNGQFILEKMEDSEGIMLILKKYHQLLLDIQSFELTDVWNLKPLFNGNVLNQQMNVPAGPKMKFLLDAMIEWQLAHPTYENPKECLEWLSSCFGSEFDPIPHSNPNSSKQKRNSN
ncbi:CCA tRNA nucleotidyltransferase, mitochondrial [Coelomomyces lativittatus]|nr:CCA tRNA nucleotidyltransferase, mitochondrial [Coelomomyces lativittatus]